MAGTLRDVTDDTFAAEVLASDKPVLVDFWAEWCGPCRLVAPVLEQLAAEHGDNIEVVQLNVDQSPRTAEKYDVRSIPTLNVYRAGKVVKTVIGARPKTALEQELREFLE
ncbi:MULTISPECIES: thioredoxin [unclassified Streptomyces]|uniref:thioredoxin n=1 Tax=unclassified Streptomyces TaxID=2593676 RepID=UPI0004CBB4EC|nr:MULTISPECIES: thioredoxin [unclassified Streptomyces]KOV92098.1 thioredoxin [Streptomyces sp. NRRL WC-3723]